MDEPSPIPGVVPGRPEDGADVVFTDEVLPELEIRELVPFFSLDGQFSIFSTQEIVAYLEALFLASGVSAADANRRAKALAAIHAGLLKPPPRPREIRGTIPVLRNPRVNHHDEEPIKVIEAFKAAASAPTFDRRQRAMDAVFFPLETEIEALEFDPDADTLYKPSRPEGITAAIAGQSDLSQVTRLFPRDGDFPLILEDPGALFQRPVFSQHQTLAEKAAEIALRKKAAGAGAGAGAEAGAGAGAGVGPLPDTPEAAFEAALTDLAKRIEATGAADEHTLNAALDLYGVVYADTSENDLRELIKRVKKAFRAVDAAAEPKTPPRAGRKGVPRASREPQEMADAGRAMLIGFGEYQKRPAKFSDSLGLYEEFLQNPPQMTTLSSIPATLTGLAEAIARRQLELKDVVEYLRMERLRRIYDYIRARVDRYGKATPERLQRAQEYLRALLGVWNRLVRPSRARSSLRFPIESELEEIKAGQDTSTYDGNPTEDPELGRLNPPTIGAGEMPIPEVLGTTGFDNLADDALWEMAETQEGSEATVTPESLGVTGLSAGADEIARILLPVFQRLRTATGLPLDLVGLVETWRAHVLRRSSADQWAGAGTGVGAGAGVNFLDLTAVQEYIATHAPIADQTALRSRARAIHEEIRAATKAAFVLGVAHWLVAIQQAAVARAFVFDPLMGSVRYLDRWSALGPPLTGATTGTAGLNEPGALTYLANVIAETPLSGTVTGVDTALQFADVGALYGAVLRTARDVFPDECLALANDWTVYRREAEQVTERIKAAEVSLAEAIQLKQPRRVLREYVTLLMYLPGLLSGKGPKTVAAPSGLGAAGCCLQKLAEDYKADSDWRQYHKRLAQLKDTFGKKRMTRVPRPAIALPHRPGPAEAEAAPEPAPAAAPAPAAPAPAEPAEAAAEPVVIAWLDRIAARPMSLALLPSTLIPSIRTDSRVLTPMTDRAIQMALRTGQRNLPKFAEMLEKVVGIDDLTGFLSSIATVLSGRRAAFPAGSPEATALTESVHAIIEFKKEWRALEGGGVLDERDVPDLRRIGHYALARAICLPADPGTGARTAATAALTLPQAVSATFLPATIKETLGMLNTAFAAREMPTLAEQQAFITQKREEQKTQVLSELDVLTVEERELVLQSRRLGFGSIGALGGALRATEPPAAAVGPELGADLVQAPGPEPDAWGEALDFPAGLGHDPDELNEEAV